MSAIWIINMTWKKTEQSQLSFLLAVVIWHFTWVGLWDEVPAVINHWLIWFFKKKDDQCLLLFPLVSLYRYKRPLSFILGFNIIWIKCYFEFISIKFLDICSNFVLTKKSLHMQTLWRNDFLSFQKTGLIISEWLSMFLPLNK